MTILYPNPCYNMSSYSEIVLYNLKKLVYRSLFVHIIVIANTSVDNRPVTTRERKAPAIYLLMKAGSPEIVDNSFNKYINQSTTHPIQLIIDLSLPGKGRHQLSTS